ncbi:MAG TPA: CAP domain-containing protein [Mycobacteriales bacterium]|nr:CAP domain-containing protein [Mycobacteriales bacterium]
MIGSAVTPRVRSRVVGLLCCLAVAVVVGPLGALRPSPAEAVTIVNGVRLNAVETKLASLINLARTSRGIPALAVAPGTSDVARRWAATQASRRTMAHNPSYSTQIAAAGSASWRAAAENVGHGRDPLALFNAYMNSPAHRANILAPQYRYLGIGWAELPDGTGYNTQNFVDSYSAIYGPSREPAYGSHLDTRVVSGATTVADFESGRDLRILTAVSGAGMTVSPVAYDAPTLGDQAGRFVAKQTAAGSGGGVEMRVRDALDLTGATRIDVTIGAVTTTRRTLTVSVAVRTAFGGTVNIGTVAIPSGRNVTVSLPLPAGARSWRNEVVVHVSRTSLAALDPASYAGRSATVYVRHVAVA